MSFYLCNLLFAHGGVATLGSTVSMLPPRRAHLAAGQREPRDFITATASLPPPSTPPERHPALRRLAADAVWRDRGRPSRPSRACWCRATAAAGTAKLPLASIPLA